MKNVILATAAAVALATPAVAADAPVSLARCDKPIGSIAVVDGDMQGWTKYGLGSPRDRGAREGLFVEVGDAYGSKGWVSFEDLK